MPIGNTSLDRRWFIKYAILSVSIFLPLAWAVLRVSNVYPVPSWNVMMVAGDLRTHWPYYVVTGETLSGEKVDVRPPHLVNSLYHRTWTLVNHTAENRNFKLPSLHPLNAQLLTQMGGVDQLPPGVRMPELLQTWGKLYNDQLPATSPKRLKSIQIDMYRWDSGRYSDYATHIRSWRKEL